MLSGCNNSPIRNPFEKRAEAKLTPVPVVESARVDKLAIAWYGQPMT